MYIFYFDELLCSQIRFVKFRIKIEFSFIQKIETNFILFFWEKHFAYGTSATANRMTNNTRYFIYGTICENTQTNKKLIFSSESEIKRKQLTRKYDFKAQSTSSNSIYPIDTTILIFLTLYFCDSSDRLLLILCLSFLPHRFCYYCVHSNKTYGKERTDRNCEPCAQQYTTKWQSPMFST